MNIRILETPEEAHAVEELQQLIWPGDDLEIVPAHMLIAAVHGGGVLLGAFDGDKLVGFVFGFPGLNPSSHGPIPMHCSHMAGVHPDYRDAGLGFKLKRAQWQVVRNQGLNHINWTYDPLQSRNANLNIAKLGAVCKSYSREYYGEMRDGINVGYPSDRLVVDWWINTSRVNRRMGKNPPSKLNLAHYLSAGAFIINSSNLDENKLPHPPKTGMQNSNMPTLMLVEIPADIQTVRSADSKLGLTWRLHIREILETRFDQGYWITDFVFLSGSPARSFYVLSHGEATF